MDHNNNTQPTLPNSEHVLTERENPPHLHVMVFKPFRKSSLSKIEKILQKESDKMNMIDKVDFTSAFERLFKQS